MKRITIEDMINAGMDKDSIMEVLEGMVDEKIKPKENPNKADAIAILQHLDNISLRAGAIKEPVDWENEPSIDIVANIIEEMAIDMAKSTNLKNENEEIPEKSEKQTESIKSDEDVLEDFLKSILG